MYNRQPGRPTKVRRKEAGEKETKTGGKKLERHKPPNDRNQPGKKKKAKSAIGTSIPASKPDNYDAEMERKNQMTEKAKQRAKVLKRDKKKAEAAATSAADSSNPTGVRKRTNAATPDAAIMLMSKNHKLECRIN
ncbi:hypothetical protein Pyn_11402 [Prunus yedoensis var. nudiflora]|uniref:Uncharacterized protein n=1 Tax=Prunus yedoensis var. nudiflora TaxID=2094558 RepID=A0A314YEB0_PRUYE|nr:hypothetical protein Pyn_11402 [Prunus yedoensis var. nudiflora]